MASGDSDTSVKVAVRWAFYCGISLHVTYYMVSFTVGL